MAPALAGHEPFVKLNGARLLKRLDDRVRVAPEREHGAGSSQPRRRSDPVSEIALGRRAQAATRPGTAERGRVGVGDVGGVDRGEVPAHRSGAVQHADRGVPVCLHAGVVLGGLLGDVRVQRRPAVTGPGGHDGCAAGVDRADAVDRGTDPGVRPLRESADPLGPAFCVTVAEAGLGRVRFAADPAMEVARVDQGHPHPGL